MINSEIVGQFARAFEALREVCISAEKSSERREVKRIALHSIEAVENYMADSPPSSYGGNLRHGIRSGADAPELATEELVAYLDQTWADVQTYLSDLRYEEDSDAWERPPLGRALYVLRHTQHHLGQISRMVDHSHDPYGLCHP